MSGVVEILCPSCYRETCHNRRGGDLVCTTCGTVRPLNSRSSPPEEDRRGVNGEGVSSRGASGGGEPSSVTTSAYAAPAYAEMLSGEALAALDGDREFARFVCAKAGIEFKQDLPQTLVLGDTRFTIRRWLDTNDRYVVRPVAEGERNPRFPGTKTRALILGQLYASVCAGALSRPNGSALPRWKRRALAEWAVIVLPPVALRALPDDAPRYVELIWPMIGLLAAVRRLTEPVETTLPLTRSFVPAWCGCDEPTMRRALAWLERHDYVGRAGHVPVGKAKPMTLWWIAEEGPS
jgi:hypothetical protein